MILGPHVIGPPSSFGAMLAERRPAAVLYLDPSDTVPWLAPLTVGRFWHDVSDQERMLNDPVASGIILADRCIESSRHNGITVWQGLNEPPVHNYDTVQRLCQLELARVQRLEEAGLTAAVLAFSVGWPAENMETRKLTNEWYAPLMSRLDPRHYVMFHQYWRSTGPLHRDSLDPDGHPSLVDRQRHWIWPHPIIIGECGIDIGGQAGDGWKSHCPPSMNLEAWADIYIDQCRQFQQLLSTDQRVRAGFIYTHGQYGWWSFETGDHWRQFAPLYAETLPEPEPVERIRVKLADGSIADMELETYLRGVLPAEMFPSWDMEALKAQAVAARTYAKIAMANPRHADEGADICTGVHCQAYNADRIDPRTDLAVELTRGQVILYDGKLANAYYSATCGGQTRSNAEVWGGDPLPWLQSVECIHKGGRYGHGVGMCQWGAHDMAENGDDYITILKHYYTGITVAGIDSRNYIPFAGSQ